MVESCERAVEREVQKQDFREVSQEFLDDLAAAIAKAREDITGKDVRKKIIGPVMQLKGCAKTFDYGLVGHLAMIMLGFLESVKELDDDAIDIVEAHHKTLSTIIHREMKGDGGSRGGMFERELRNACERYHARRTAKPKS